MITMKLFNHTNAIQKYLVNRGHPISAIGIQTEKAKSIPKAEIFNPKSLEEKIVTRTLGGGG